MLFSYREFYVSYIKRKTKLLTFAWFSKKKLHKVMQTHYDYDFHTIFMIIQAALFLHPFVTK